jgi:hypothetical protein
MVMTKERRPPTRTLRGWAISVLHEAGAIKAPNARRLEQRAKALLLPG